MLAHLGYHILYSSLNASRVLTKCHPVLTTPSAALGIITFGAVTECHCWDECNRKLVTDGWQSCGHGSQGRGIRLSQERREPRKVSEGQRQPTSAGSPVSWHFSAASSPDRKRDRSLFAVFVTRSTSTPLAQGRANGPTGLL